MSEYMIQGSTLSGIASAIRTRAGVSEAFTPAQMASAILAIPSAQTVSVTFSENGMYIPDDYDADAFSQVNVSVPTPSTSAITVSSNGTYKPSTYGVDAFSQVTVEVSGGGGGGGGAAFKSYTEGTLWYVYDSTISKIGSSAFALQDWLLDVTFESVSMMGEGAFASCAVEKVSMPALVSVPMSGFTDCLSLQSAYFSSALYVGHFAFKNDENLSDVSFPLVQIIGNEAFGGCISLSEINLPSLTTINLNAFKDCDNLASISIPLCETISDKAFYNCMALSEIIGPMLTVISYSAFEGCYGLSMVSLGKKCTIRQAAFSGCQNLFSLYLNGSSVCTLNNSNAFYFTPMQESMEGAWGSIFVPSSLYASYVAHSVWSWFASRFVSM